MTFEDSSRPLWDGRKFTVDPDADQSGTGSSAVKRLTGPITLNVPLTRLHLGELFAVHVSLYASTFNDRGDESGAQAFIEDPQHVRPGLRAHGLDPRGKPRFKEPPVTPPPAARCPAGARLHAGTLQFSDGRFAVDEAISTPLVQVTRTGGSRGAPASCSAPAAGRRDRASISSRTRTLVRFEKGTPRRGWSRSRSARTARSNRRRTSGIARPPAMRAARAARSATAMILDDDQPPPPPPPAFTIGGTVDGLAGLRAGAVEPWRRGAGVRERELYVSRHRLERSGLRGQRQDPAEQPRSGVHGGARRRAGTSANVTDSRCIV